MLKRKVPDRVVFDKESAINYDKQSRGRMRSHARGIVSRAKSLGIIGGKALDIGTGPGNLAIELALGIPNIEVIGLDLSDEVLELAKERAYEIGVTSRVSFIKGDASAIPFEDGSFDLVVGSFTFHLIENPVIMLDEIHRVLKPTGKFIISDFRRNVFALVFSPVRASYTHEELIDILKESKLENYTVDKNYFTMYVHSK